MLHNATTLAGGACYYGAEGGRLDWKMVLASWVARVSRYLAGAEVGGQRDKFFSFLFWDFGGFGVEGDDLQLVFFFSFSFL